jgi:hypothetical protein
MAFSSIETSRPLRPDGDLSIDSEVDLGHLRTVRVEHEFGVQEARVPRFQINFDYSCVSGRYLERKTFRMKARLEQSVTVSAHDTNRPIRCVCENESQGKRAPCGYMAEGFHGGIELDRILALAQPSRKAVAKEHSPQGNARVRHER